MSKKYVSVLKDSAATPGYRIIAPEDYVYTENGTKKVKKIDSKADKKVPATAGNLATLDSSGNLADSGKQTTDFMNALTTAYEASGSATKTVTKVAQAKTGAVTVTYSDIQSGTTSQKGLVQLENSTSSTSTTTAATPNSVKSAYDLANGKYSKPSGGIPSSDMDSTVQASLGKADTAIQGVKLNGSTLTPSSAKVVDLGNLKTKQTAVSDPSASGTTITAIATISQNANGVITATKKTIQSASQSQDGVMSAADKTKLDGIATGAEVNQNAFSNVKVGDVTVAADTKTDTLTLAAGSNVTITPDATNDKITIAAKDTTYTADAGIRLDGTVFKHTNSVSGGTVGPTTDTAGATLSVPYVTYDSQGHVTASGTRTHNVGTASTSGAGIVQLQDSIDATTTKAATPNAVKKAIEALDVSSVGGSGKYISAISETDGKISATSTTMDTTPTANSEKAVTSGGVKTALDSKVSKSGDTMTGRLVNTAGVENAIQVSHGTANTNSCVSMVRTDTGTQMYVGVDSGGYNHGVYSNTNGNWIIKASNAGKVTINDGKATSTVAIGNSDIGSTTKPVYLDDGIIKEGSTYAGGTAVTLNNSSKAASTASFYAPTGAGTNRRFLRSNGSGEPSWVIPACDYAFRGDVWSDSGNTKIMWAFRLKGITTQSYNNILLSFDTYFWNNQKSSSDLIYIGWSNNGTQRFAATAGRVRVCGHDNVSDSNYSLKYYYVKNNADTAAGCTLDIYIAPSRVGNSYGAFYVNVLNSSNRDLDDIIEKKETYNVALPEGAVEITYTGNIETATKAIQDSDGNQINSTYLKLSGGTMTGKITALGSQYSDSYSSGAIDMNNSNIVGLNSIYTAGTSDNAKEGIHFYRDATHTDTLWMAGGHMYFVPNRVIVGDGSSTTAADSKKVVILPASITTNQMVVTDGTSGDVKGVDAYNGRGVIAAVGLADGRRNRGNATGDGWGKIASITKSSGIASTNISSVWSIVCNTSSTNSVYILRINIRGTSGSLPSTRLCKLYGNDDFDTTQFGIKLVIRGTSASSVTAEIWACTSKNYTGIAISELAGGEMEMGNTRKWTYYTVSGGGEAAPVADATNNVQVVDPVIDTYSWNHFYNGIREVSFNSSVTVATFLSNAQTTNSFANLVFGAGLTDTALLTINAIGMLNISNNTNIQTELENLGGYPMFHVVATRQAGYVEFEGNGKKVRYHFGTSGALTNKYYEFVKLNNSVSATPSFYAPTAGGTANYVLIGNGTTSTPTWAEKAPKAVVADYPAGFASRLTTWGWGTLTTANGYTQVTEWHTSNNSDIAFAEKSGSISVQIDGKFYQNDGANKVLDAADVSVPSTVPTLAWNTESTLATIDGKNIKVKLPASPDTDTKVTQTVDSATTGNLPLLAKNTTGTSTVTDTSRFAAAISMTPSTGTVNATQYKVNEHCTMKYNSTKSSLDFTFS